MCGSVGRSEKGNGECPYDKSIAHCECGEVKSGWISLAGQDYNSLIVETGRVRERARLEIAAAAGYLRDRGCEEKRETNTKNNKQYGALFGNQM